MSSYETDRSHLTILAVFHYVMAGLSALGGCAGLLYVALGLMLFAGGMPDVPDSEDAMIGGAFLTILGLVILAFSWGWAFAMAYAGRCLTTHRKRMFCLVVAAVSCLGFPFGTILGVFTLVVLNRESVIQLFEGAGLETTPR
jgi:hypothetical protein